MNAKMKPNRKLYLVCIITPVIMGIVTFIIGFLGFYSMGDEFTNIVNSENMQKKSIFEVFTESDFRKNAVLYKQYKESMLVSMIVTTSFFVLIPLFFYKREFIMCRLRQIRPKPLINKGSVIGLVFIYFSYIFFQVIVFNWLYDNNETTISSLNIRNESLGYQVLILFITVIYAPFCEELFFRGLLLNEYARLHPEKKVSRIIGWQAGVFYLNHLIMGNFGLTILLLGLTNGMLAYSTGTLFYGIVLHAVFNLAGILGASKVIYFELDTYVGLMCLVLGVILLVLSNKYFRKQYKERLISGNVNAIETSDRG
ncbi:MAG: CPBP family intramembrane metalloprotease [Spirochaetaceae bacterium]|jgi:membrane protease YdiL (CAAX protease family)|nr:CPBP family intramembrane metalloprotease [Spirochaetaceae bacterium]